MQQTVYREEPRYLVVALFTASMIAASMVIVAIGTLLPYLASTFSIAREHLGIVVTTLLLGSLLTTAVTGALTDRFGDKTVLRWSGVLMGVALIASGLVPSFTWLLFWFFIYGLGFAAVTPAGSHAILFLFKPNERGLAMGLRQTGVPLGGFLGAVLFTSVASRYGYATALIITGVVVLIVSTVSAALYLEPSELRGERITTRALFTETLEIGREPRLILLTLGSMALICVQMTLIGFLPITLIDQAHLTLATASSVFALSQVAAVAGRLFWGLASDRYCGGNRYWPLVIASAVSGVAALAVSAIGHTPLVTICAIAIVLGFAGEGWFGLAACAMAEIGGEHHAGSALGFGLTWIFAAGVVAPIVFGFLANLYGFPSAWIAIAVVAFAGVVPLLLERVTNRAYARRATAGRLE